MSETYGALIPELEQAVARQFKLCSCTWDFSSDRITHHDPACPRHGEPHNPYSPIECIAVRLHGRFNDHDDPPSGLGKDCPVCLEAALDVMNIAVLTIGGQQ